MQKKVTYSILKKFKVLLNKWVIYKIISSVPSPVLMQFPRQTIFLAAYFQEVIQNEQVTRLYNFAIFNLNTNK